MAISRMSEAQARNLLGLNPDTDTDTLAEVQAALTVLTTALDTLADTSTDAATTATITAALTLMRRIDPATIEALTPDTPEEN